MKPNTIYKRNELTPVRNGGGSVTTTTATEPGWLLYYILETYQLIKSISGKY